MKVSDLQKIVKRKKRMKYMPPRDVAILANHAEAIEHLTMALQAIALGRTKDAAIAKEALKLFEATE
jgi:hypothetical protein